MKVPALFATLLLASAALGQEAAPAPKLAPHQERFSNLPEAKRNEFIKLFNEAQKLFSEKRVFDTIAKLDDAEKIFSDSPEIANIRGACQVEFRNFDKARGYFEAARKAAPDDPSILFNIAEVDFVTKKYADAETKLVRILEISEKNKAQLQLSRLVEFKLMLCRIKLGKTEEAQKMAKKYDFLDDSPFPYYAEAALAFEAGKEVEGEAAIARAARIFADINILSPWQDTMIEIGYVKGFFGDE